MRRSLILLGILLSAASVLFAGNTGKIVGKITDKSTGESLYGANVIIVGTHLGSTGDINGNFVILNIPAGVYEVRASFIGYRSVTITGVRIFPDFTTELNFELPQEAIEIQEVTVVAERKLIQKDATSTVSVLDQQQLQALPVTGFTQALVIAPGFVSSNNGSGNDGIHLRGGRSGELTFVIDGVRVNDPLYGGLTMDLPRSGVSSLTVMSGTFNAEYGNAQSGVVNITTPEGGRNLRGMLRTASDQFGGETNNWGSYRYEFSVNGPLPNVGLERDALGFFISGDHSYSRTYLNRSTGPQYSTPGGREVQNTYDFGLSDKRSRLNGKLTIRPLEELKINVSSAYSVRDNRDYTHYFKAMPEYNGFDKTESFLHSVQAVHTFSPTTFMDVKFSYYEKNYKH